MRLASCDLQQKPRAVYAAEYSEPKQNAVFATAADEGCRETANANEGEDSAERDVELIAKNEHG